MPAKAKPRTYQSALVTLQETPSNAIGRPGGWLEGRPQVGARAVDRAQLILRSRELLASLPQVTPPPPGLASTRGFESSELDPARSPSRAPDDRARRRFDRG